MSFGISHYIVEDEDESKEKKRTYSDIEDTKLMHYYRLKDDIRWTVYLNKLNREMDTAQLLPDGPLNREEEPKNSKLRSYLKAFSVTITKGFRSVGLYFDGF